MIMKNNTSELTCIECPKGCKLFVGKDENGKLKVSGHSCLKGEKYAIDEVNSPVRILTSTVRAVGLVESMVPVRTSRPIPRDSLFSAMELIKSITLNSAVECGQVIVNNFMGLTDVDLVATRSINNV